MVIQHLKWGLQIGKWLFSQRIVLTLLFFVVDIGEKLSAIFEKQTLATVQEKKLTKEEADRKAAILAQYGQVSDGEEYPFWLVVML